MTINECVERVSFARIAVNNELYDYDCHRVKLFRHGNIGHLSRDFLIRHQIFFIATDKIYFFATDLHSFDNQRLLVPFFWSLNSFK